MRLSGLQKEVLALYRHCLRESRKKPEVPAVPSPKRVQFGYLSGCNTISTALLTGQFFSQATRPHFQAFARSEFAKSRDIDKRDFAAIEFLLRKGKRQLQVYSSDGIKDIR